MMGRIWVMVAAFAVVLISVGTARADVFFSDGMAHSFNGTEAGGIFVSGTGTSLDILSPASIGGDVNNYGPPSVVTILGGSISGDVLNYGTGSLMEIRGGSVAGDVYNYGFDTILEIKGGTFGGSLLSYGIRSITRIYGTNFQIDGMDVPYGSFQSTVFNTALTGTLADGSPLAVNMSHFGIDSSMVFIQSVPEPASFAMLGTGTLGLILAARKRRQTKLAA